MTSVLGLDLSATKAGVALPDGRLVTLHAPKVPSGDLDAYAQRLEWWSCTFDTLLTQQTPEVVVIEDYFLRAPSRRVLTTIAEVVGCAVAMLPYHRARYWSVKPDELKEWATGDRRAGKDAMVAAAVARGAAPANDDEADAFLLRAYALDLLAREVA